MHNYGRQRQTYLSDSVPPLEAGLSVGQQGGHRPQQTSHLDISVHGSKLSSGVYEMPKLEGLQHDGRTAVLHLSAVQTDLHSSEIIQVLCD